MAQSTLRSAKRCDRISDRSSEIVIRRRLWAPYYRCSVHIAHALGPMQGRPVQQKPKVPRVVLGDAVHPKETANLGDTWEGGVEAGNGKSERGEAKEPSGLPSDQHHSGNQEKKPTFDRLCEMSWWANIEPNK